MDFMKISGLRCIVKQALDLEVPEIPAVKTY